METAIVGLPLAGKTTIFNALTGLGVPVSSHVGAEHRPNVASVEVPDERVERLAVIFRPRRTVFATVRVKDLQLEITEAGEISAASLGEMRSADALVLVVRAFQDETVPHPLGSADPARDYRRLMETLVLADLAAAERRTERLAREGRRGEREYLRLQRLVERLGQGKPIGSGALSGEDRSLFAGFGFLTAKPAILIANTGEAGLETTALAAAARADGIDTFEIQGSLEAEIAGLAPGEQDEFLAAAGVSQPARARFLRALYSALGLISFLTVGEDEVRAWSVPKGALAPQAAGRIHSDLERGFIRAEVIPWRELLEAGGLKAAKEAGRLRLEGREYTVQDGDVITIRANS